jgi:hypothetical protein
MPVVDTTRTFTNNEQITSTKLNEIMDNSLFVAGAVVSGQGLEVTAGGQMQIQNAGITPAKLSNSDFGDFTVSGGVATIDSGVITPTKLSQPFTSGTAVTASGSSVTFGSLPSWITRISILFDSLSTNGTEIVYVRAGSSGSLATTGYDHFYGTITATPAADAAISSNGILISGNAASAIRFGCIVLSKIGSSNKWVINGQSARNQSGVANSVSFHAGTVTLSSTLDIVGIQCGANTFDAGTVNVIYQ